ncbi:MAG: ScpA family protein [Candidatus Hadarchaeales archaeon]
MEDDVVGEMIDQPIQTLVELVRQHKVDPWDVDLQKIVSLYIQMIGEMREPDLRASGRALLSAAVLLRIKSAFSWNGNGGQEVTEQDLLEIMNVDFPDIGEVTIIQNTPRKLTLSDLLGALQEALSEMPQKRVTRSRRMEKIVQMLNEYEINIEKHIEEMYGRIRQVISSGGAPTLLSLAGERTRCAIARTFLLLLFLCASGRVRLSQPEPFGDIAVSLTG